MGENDSGTRYDSIDLIFRNASKVEEFIGKADLRPGEKPLDPRAKETRIRKAAEQLTAGVDEYIAHALVQDEYEWAEAIERVRGAA
jgi:hypothetical protein